MSVVAETNIQARSPSDSPLWELQNLSKAFPGVQALDKVSFSIYRGEVHALVGENGSGKSTLAKCLAGVHQPESGEIIFQGEPVRFNNPTESHMLGVATIYQEFSLVPTLTVVENIFLGRYPHNSIGVIDWSTVRQETVNLLEDLSLDINPDAKINTLSVAEQQLVEIAKAISLESNLLIMDEPTAALGLLETQHLMDLIRRLTAQNKAIIYISHRLDEIFEIADRVTILKDGKRVKTAQVSELKMSDVVRSMIGFDIKDYYPKVGNVQPVTCLEVENLSTEDGVREVSFSVNVGEVFGLGGMLGSGRTEIGRAIYGAEIIKSGRIRLAGKEVKFHSPNQAVAAGVGMVPENRKSDGLYFNFETPKNITISRLSELLQGPFLTLSKEQMVGQTYVDKMNLPPASLERSVIYLSGGNQQKVIVARWLFSQARLLIMDEPTQGIDIGAKIEVYNVINELTASGISVILISSDFPELLAMSDRVAVVRDGQIIHIDKASRLTEYQLIGLASGVGVSDEIEEWMDLRRIAFPHLQSLRDTTRIPVHLAVLDRREMTLFYLDKVAIGSTEMISLTGASDPLNCTGLGKLLLAFEPFKRVQEWVAKVGLPRFTENTITNSEDFLAEIQTIRQQGFSLDREEHELGMRSIAVPLTDAQGKVIAAISITGPVEMIPLDKVNTPLREALIQTAEAISTEYASREI